MHFLHTYYTIYTHLFMTYYTYIFVYDILYIHLCLFAYLFVAPFPVPFKLQKHLSNCSITFCGVVKRHIFCRSLLSKTQELPVAIDLVV